MAMRILKHEAPSFVRAETLYGIAIEVDMAYVVHLYTEESRVSFWKAYCEINIYESLRDSWIDTYTGHRNLELNAAWR